MEEEKSLKNLFKNMNFGFDITILVPSLHFQTKKMKFIAEIDVMPLKALLDPHGKAVSGSMKNLGLPEITNVRIGKHIQLEVEAVSEEEAKAKVDKACKQLLANQIMESYSFSVVAV
jgi:phosphoribosylformylglycinamidine synthase